MRKKIFLRHLLYLAVILAYTFLIGCPLYRLTGRNCPFCGMSRAHFAFFGGDLKSALEYHELFFFFIPCMLAVAHMRILKKRKLVYFAAVVFVALCAAAFIVRYIYRICLRL